MEWLITLGAAMGALYCSRRPLSAILCAAWVASLACAMLLPASLLPGAASLVDMFICIGALAMWTQYGSQRSRCVGLLSLAKIFVHFGISANLGNGNWFAYAITINALFVLQCLIAGGAFYGVVRFIDSVSPRRNIRHSNNTRGVK